MTKRKEALFTITRGCVCALLGHFGSNLIQQNQVTPSRFPMELQDLSCSSRTCRCTSIVEMHRSLKDRTDKEDEQPSSFTASFFWCMVYVYLAERSCQSHVALVSEWRHHLVGNSQEVCQLHYYKSHITTRLYLEHETSSSNSLKWFSDPYQARCIAQVLVRVLETCDGLTTDLRSSSLQPTHCTLMVDIQSQCSIKLFVFNWQCYKNDKNHKCCMKYSSANKRFQDLSSSHKADNGLKMDNLWGIKHSHLTPCWSRMSLPSERFSRSSFSLWSAHSVSASSPSGIQ